MFVHEKIYDKFCEKSAEVSKARVVGDQFTDGVDQGPQVDGEQFSKIMNYIKLGKD